MKWKGFPRFRHLDGLLLQLRWNFSLTTLIAGHRFKMPAIFYASPVPVQVSKFPSF